MVRSTHSLNSTFSSYSDSNTAFTEGQTLLSSTLQGFSRQAADPANLLAMTAGSFGFRLGKLVAAESLSALGLARFAPLSAIQAGAFGTGLLTEVASFRATSNLLNGGALSDTLNRNEFLASTTDFAALKLAGRFGGNLLLSNLLQSSAMVAGHDISAQFHWAEHDPRSYVERLAEAQATALALNAGSALFGRISGGRTHFAERALEGRLNVLESVRQAARLENLHTASPGITSMSANGELRATEENGTSPSPRNPTPRSTPPAGRNTGRTGRILKGIADRAEQLVTRFDFNYFTNPARPVPPPSTREPAEPIHSIQEGIDRTRITGHDQETLSFLRWGAAQLREQSKVRQSFFQDMQELFRVQQRLRELWEPILAKLPRPNLATLNQRARTYLDRLATLAPTSNHYYAEHLVLAARLAQLNLRTREDYERLSDTQLREMGIEPEAISSIERNAHVFTTRELRARLDHPLLRNLPETQQILETHEQLQRDFTDFNPRFKEAEKEMDALRSLISITADAERRAELEGEIKKIADPFNREYWKMTGPVQQAMRTFLSNSVNARVLLLQNAFHASLRSAVLGMNPWQVASHLKTQGELLPSDQAALAKTIQTTVELVGERGFVARSFYAALRLFTQEPVSPQVLRRRYEVALTQLVEEASPAFWNLPQPEEAALKEAMEAQTSYFQEYYRVVDESRSAMAELGQRNQNFWESFDRETQPLILRDLERQLEQASTYIEAFGKKIGNDFYDRTSSQNESDAMKYKRLTLEAKKAIDALSAMNAQPKIVSRDLNRKREAAYQKVQDLFKFANQMRRRENRIINVARKLGVLFKNGKNGDAPLVPVSIMALPYVQKFQSAKHHGLAESLRVLGPLVWQTLPRVLRLVNAVAKHHSFTTHQSIFADWASEMARSRGDTFVVDPHADALCELQTSQFAGKHAGWPDFAWGPTPGAGIAQRQGSGSSTDTPLILAKAGLGKLMSPLFAAPIDILTEAVGDCAVQFERSVTRAARTLTQGDTKNASLRPANAAAYDELTMTVINLISPYRFSPFEGTSEILTLPQGGRSFRIADRAMALSSRPQNFLTTAALNSSVIYPKPDRPAPIRDSQITTVTNWLPAQALGWGMGGNHALGAQDFETNGNNGNGHNGITHESNGLHGKNSHPPASCSLAPPAPESHSAHWLRTRWYEMATVPEYRTVTPSVQRIFAPFERPVEAAVEQTLEQMFGGAEGVYPNAAGARRYHERVQELEARQAEMDRSSDLEIWTQTERELTRVRGAREAYETNLVRLSLQRARLELNEVRQAEGDKHDIAEMECLLKLREKTHRRLEAKMKKNQALTESEQRTWNALIESAENNAEIQRVRTVHTQISTFYENLFSPRGNGVAGIYADVLKQRISQVKLALVRSSLGENLSPAEELLIQELEASFNQTEATRDRIVEAIRQEEAGTLTATERQRIYEEERIREETRQLVRALPGAGRGTIDYVTEKGQDVAAVMFNEATHEVIRGPRSHWATLDFTARFALVGFSIGTLGVIDFITNNHFNVYTRASAAMGRFIMEASHWRPQIDLPSIRALEEARIISKRDRRPIVIASAHTSWTDITSLMSLLPETRFTFKPLLFFVPPLTLPLLGGRHTAIPRGNRQKAFEQIQAAKRKMLRYDIATTHFWGGTRSKTGSVSPAKKGGAHLIKDSNAITLVAGLNGPFDIMPVSWGDFLGKGTGTHRPTYLRFSVFDHQSITDILTSEGETRPITSEEKVLTISGTVQNQLIEHFMASTEQLRQSAQAGNVVAEGQLAEEIQRFELGMNLLQQGNTDEARTWAEGDRKKSQGRKTDFKLLQRMKEWRDSIHNSAN